MKKRIALILVSLAVIVFLVPTAFAGRGGGRGNNPAAGASCSASGTLVQATGLPTDQVINFMLSDSTGTSGWVLGYTWDGTFSVNVPAASGTTSYAFVSRTWGNDGSKYSTFASCSA